MFLAGGAAGGGGVIQSFSRNVLSVVISLLWVIHSVVLVGQPASQFDIQQHKQQHQQQTDRETEGRADGRTDGWTEGRSGQ